MIVHTKYPEVKVTLLGEDGNAFYILGAVRKALLRAGVGNTECENFVEEATSGDYNDLLTTVMKWVEVI